MTPFGEFQDRDHVGVVFVRALFVVAKGRDLRNLLAGKPAHGIHGMAAAHQHRASARWLRRMAPLPAAATSRPGRANSRPRRRTVRRSAPAASRSLRFSNSGFQRSTKLTTLFTPAVRTRVAQCAVLVHRQAHRLLDQNVLAGLGGGDALFGMDVVRAAQVDDVHAFVGQDMIVGVADMAVLDSQLADQRCGTRP